jgi:hypothetical protein
MLNHYETALESLRSTLAADGYLLQIDTGATDAKIILTIKAEPHACPTCLIPADMLTAIAERDLADRGLNPAIAVIYPEINISGIKNRFGRKE